MIILIAGFLCGEFITALFCTISTDSLNSVVAVVWAVTYNLSPLQYLRLAAIMIIRDYLATGVVVATLLWRVFPRFPIENSS